MHYRREPKEWIYTTSTSIYFFIVFNWTYSYLVQCSCTIKYNVIRQKKPERDIQTGIENITQMFLSEQFFKRWKGGQGLHFISNCHLLEVFFEGLKIPDPPKCTLNRWRLENFQPFFQSSVAVATEFPSASKFVFCVEESLLVGQVVPRRTTY